MTGEVCVTTQRRVVRWRYVRCLKPRGSVRL